MCHSYSAGGAGWVPFISLLLEALLVKIIIIIIIIVFLFTCALV